MPTKESSLKNPRSRYVQQAYEARQDQGIPDRKMTLDPSEWVQSSDYGRTEVAATMLPALSRNWAPNGLLIIPTMSEVGAKGNFVLEVHSDQPTHLVALPDNKSRTVAGDWGEGSSGGSHMHPSWKKNPRYHLRLLGDQTQNVKITLSRPDETWKGQLLKDSIGSMMGFYVVQGPRAARDGAEIYYNGNPWSETPFVPMNSVSTPPNFELEVLEDEVYTIIPATFEPAKKGPFFLSVVSDKDFTLQRDSDKSGSSGAGWAGGGRK